MQAYSMSGPGHKIVLLVLLVRVMSNKYSCLKRTAIMRIENVHTSRESVTETVIGPVTSLLYSPLIPAVDSFHPQIEQINEY